MTHQRTWTDEETLEVLALHDEGLTCAEIGRRYGVGKNAIIGLRGRIREADAKHWGSVGDGTLPSRWWRRA